jgi:hypothetical protein
VWGLLVLFASGVFVINLSGYITQLQTLCTGASCGSVQLSAAGVLSLEHLGLSLGQYSAFNIALTLMAALVGYGLAALLVLRRSDDWMGLLVALLLICSASQGVNTNQAVHPNVPSQWMGPVFASILANLASSLGFGSLVLKLYLFPDGRFVPRWTRWVMPLFVGVALLVIFVPLTPSLGRFIDLLSTGAGFGIFISLVIAQVYRYRRVSSSFQRQQTKWVVYSLTVNMLLIVGIYWPLQFFPALTSPGSLSASIITTTENLLSLPLPLSFVLAILRFRLWDIDLLINRTLVYGTLSAILALVYFGLILALQYLLRGIINQNNSVALVISTLISAALFQPLRHRVQAVIDRRFYRRKYDAARTVEALSATLRAEMDLEQLQKALLAVVEETMQPAHVSLWLPPAKPDSKPPTAWSSSPPAP